MKKFLILNFLLFQCLGMWSAPTLGDGNGKKMEIKTNNISFNDYIVFSDFNATTNQMEINFLSEVKMIQAFDTEGNLALVVPIDSSEVVLGLSLFEEGHYTLGFLIDGEEEVKLTELIVR